MTSFIRSIALAALLAAGSAWAQQPADNPDNPHSTKAKDKASSDTAQATPSDNASVNAAEKNNPYSTDYKDREKTDSSMQGSMDHDAMMKSATPQMQLQKLHLTNLHEIEAGKLAEQNGTERVKAFAQALQRDHQAADKQVMDLAKKKNFTLTDQPKDAQKHQHAQMEKDQLTTLKGAQFDHAFANQMAMGHKKVISLAQAWTQDCKDRDVCSLIDSLMPKLQQHEQMAEQLRGPLPQGRAPETR